MSSRIISCCSFIYFSCKIGPVVEVYKHEALLFHLAYSR